MMALQKTTHVFVFAHHGIPLECDIYGASDYSNIGLLHLFSHRCGPVGGARTFIPPWIVQVGGLPQQGPEYSISNIPFIQQTCKRLLRASHSLLPQAGGQGLLQNATATNKFAKRLGNGPKRKDIIEGASVGSCPSAYQVYI